MFKFLIVMTQYIYCRSLDKIKYSKIHINEVIIFLQVQRFEEVQLTTDRKKIVLNE